MERAHQMAHQKYMKSAGRRPLGGCINRHSEPGFVPVLADKVFERYNSLVWNTR